MEFINKRAGIFRNLVVKYFVNTYNLKIVNNICKLMHSNSIYVKSNCIVMNNKIINDMYNANLDIEKYSIVFVNYKNINFKKHDNDFTAILNTDTKHKMLKTFMDCRNKSEGSGVYFDEKVLLIGRKYSNVNDKGHKITNCFGLFCTLNLKDIKFRNTNTITDTKLNLDNLNKELLPVNTSKSKFRRAFLMNIKEMLNQNQNGEIYRLISNGIYLDIEFTNDIYDDFKDFPNSNDADASSIMFMIGIFCKNKGYRDFTVNRLCKDDEKYILEMFLNFIEDRYLTKGMKVLLFHWSNADKYIIEKSLQKYPELYIRYSTISEHIQYIDLLKIFKQTVTLPSYSLKYVSKHFLNTSYESDCKNGLDAMCSIIQNEISLQNTNTSNLNLSYFKTTMDIIKYNQTDTTLLYQLLKYFIY